MTYPTDRLNPKGETTMTNGTNDRTTADLADRRAAYSAERDIRRCPECGIGLVPIRGFHGPGGYEPDTAVLYECDPCGIAGDVLAKHVVGTPSFIRWRRVEPSPIPELAR